MQTRTSLVAYARLSIAAALVTIALKAGAYQITGSVGLLADALESIVNLAAALLALVALRVSVQPPDEEHPYGHEKVEYFSSGVESVLMVLAGLVILFEAARRLLDPRALQDLDLGILLSLLAAAINLVVARVLSRAGRRFRSITLQAGAAHLLTDVWTTGAVVLAIALVKMTGWSVLDPTVAFLLAGQILWIGLRLLSRSVNGLMDRALPPSQILQVESVLDSYRAAGVRYHALLTRRAGARRFVSFHVQVPGDWSVQKGHDLLEEIEGRLRGEMDGVHLFTHLEPIEDPTSWEDEHLDRP